MLTHVADRIRPLIDRSDPLSPPSRALLLLEIRAVWELGAFFAMAPMLRLVVWHRPLHLGNYVGLGLYALCAAASAVGPVYLLHRALARKRERMLGLLAGGAP